jgi:hypothetical protein
MRSALAGLAVLALLALVAAGSAGEEWGGGLQDRNVSRAVGDYAFTLVVVFIVLTLAIAVWALTGPGGAPKKERPKRRELLSFALLLLAAAAYLAYADPRPPRPVEPEQQAAPGATTQIVEEVEPGPERTEPGVEFKWWVAIAVGLAAAGAVAYLRLSRDPPPEPRDAKEELEAVLGQTLDELELDDDPRRAVIQAYVRMEAVLAVHGHARRPHEAPLEYLARVLRELEVRPEAAHALTELFERARFSRHEIDAAMRAEAVASLAAVRDDLRAAA